MAFESTDYDGGLCNTRVLPESRRGYAQHSTQQGQLLGPSDLTDTTGSPEKHLFSLFTHRSTCFFFFFSSIPSPWPTVHLSSFLLQKER